MQDENVMMLFPITSST